MNNVWTYRSDIALGDGDLIGYDVEASDGHIGKIDEASRETDSDHLVVDTGFWIFGKKRLIPAGVASRVDTEKKTVLVNMTKDEIKDAPDWEANWTDDAAERDTYREYYAPYGW